MHRFYLTPEECRGSSLLLAGGEAHHALHVIRVRPGERVTVLNGAGGQFLCEVAKQSRDSVRLQVLESVSVPPPPCRITLAQALPKGKGIESIIQKATELGVAQIVPLLAERSVIQVAQEDREQKKAKWQSVAIEAIKQCGAAWLPRVEGPVAPKDFLACGQQFEMILVGSLQSDSQHPRQYFDAFHRKHGRKASAICLWIGPEGDFTQDELSAFQGVGALPITLGPLVLRSETAAIYCMSIVSYELRSP
jgi:16S rRNA (uracil1498-N3)-methyltransferase